MALLFKKVTASTTESSYKLPDGTRRVIITSNIAGPFVRLAPASMDEVVLSNFYPLVLDSDDLGNRSLYFQTAAGTADIGLVIFTGTI